jgi:hypothetical protein
MSTNSALFSLYIISDVPDDVVRVYAIDGESDFYTLQYKVGDTGRVHETNMCRADLRQYVADLLSSLSLDISPVDRIQFESCISPSIMISVDDLNNYRVVDVIENTLVSALTNVKRTA